MNVQNAEDFHSRFADAFNSGDVDSVLSLYEPGATLVPGPDQIASGHPAIREALTGFQAAGQMTASTRYCVEVDDLALASASWEIKGSAPDGQPVEVSGVSSDLLHRLSDGRWLLVVDHSFGGS
jgi:uncharacterized protein (TIGR02246 family)